MYNKNLIKSIKLQEGLIILQYQNGIIKKLEDKYLVSYLKYNNFNKNYWIECINEAIQVRNNYYKNKNKLTFKKLVKILENNNNGYYNYQNYKIDNKKGCLYYLSKPINNEFKEKLSKAFNNIQFFISECQYAKEIKRNVIFIEK